MAKKPKQPKHELSKGQIDELRRLYQNANRRIARATEAYEKAGMKVAPRTLTGGYQIRQQWETEKYAMSRTVVFATKKEYLERLEFLRSFDPKSQGKQEKRPTVTQYTKIQREKTLDSVHNIIGGMTEALEKRIMKMSAPQLTAFWKVFSEKARKMGVKYSSNEAMMETLKEFFPEDWEQFNNIKSEEVQILQFKRDMMGKSG